MGTPRRVLKRNSSLGDKTIFIDETSVLKPVTLASIDLPFCQCFTPDMLYGAKSVF